MKEIELLGNARITLISDRRIFRPYGMNGGEPGRAGRNRLVTGDREIELPGKCSVDAHAGDRLLIETPGGGGWGEPS